MQHQLWYCILLQNFHCIPLPLVMQRSLCNNYLSYRLTIRRLFLICQQARHPLESYQSLPCVTSMWHLLHLWNWPLEKYQSFLSHFPLTPIAISSCLNFCHLWLSKRFTISMNSHIYEKVYKYGNAQTMIGTSRNVWCTSKINEKRFICDSLNLSKSAAQKKTKHDNLFPWI